MTDMVFRLRAVKATAAARGDLISPLDGSVSASSLAKAIINVAEGKTKYGDLYSAVVYAISPRDTPLRAVYLSPRAVDKQLRAIVETELARRRDGLVFEVDSFGPQPPAIDMVLRGGDTARYSKSEQGWVNAQSGDVLNGEQ